jgi:hypothetical protein
MPEPVDVFFLYSHDDEALRDELAEHLSGLRRQGVIRDWHDRRIEPGEDRRAAIDKELDAAQVILLLVSAAFLASDECYEVDLKRALERERAGEARLIPILLRKCDLGGASFVRSSALPSDGRAVTSWANRDEAWSDVAEGIRRVVEGLAGPSKARRKPAPSRRATIKRRTQAAL